MSREVELLLEDIATACRKIEDWTRSLTFEQFAAQGMPYSAVLRELLVIGEAVKQVPADVRQEAPDIPWRELAGLRDVVVHQYFGLQDATLWSVVREDIPSVGASVRTLQVTVRERFE